MSRDPVFDSFLARQYQEGMALAAGSDLLELFPLDGMPPSRYSAIVRDWAGYNCGSRCGANARPSM